MSGDVLASTEGAALLAEFQKLVASLNEMSEGKYKCRGKIHTTAKGEAQFEISTRADTPEEVKATNETLLDGAISLCKAKNIKIAGASP